MCGRPKSSITTSVSYCSCAGANLPKLSSGVAASTNSNNPYELMYGKSYGSSTSPEKKELHSRVLNNRNRR